MLTNLPDGFVEILLDKDAYKIGRYYRAFWIKCIDRDPNFHPRGFGFLPRLTTRSPGFQDGEEVNND